MWVGFLLVVLDLRSKSFFSLETSFHIKNSGRYCFREVVKLHAILCDFDPIFLSSFWQELFRVTNTTLMMCSAYHPKNDGQTEVVNRCVETYLHCFSFEWPQQWSKLLSWVEYCFSTSYHILSGTTPFDVYDHAPRVLRSFLWGEIRVQALAETLQSRDDMLNHLFFHLERAQQLMVR